MRRKLIGVLVLVVLVGGVSGYWFTRSSGTRTTGFRSEQARRGDLRATISASGTLEPEFVVDVGAQVVGQIIRFGDDKNKIEKGGKDKASNKYKPIDYGSEVAPGTVLAQIDDKLYKARLEQSEAMLRSAQQKVKQAEAQRGSAAAKLEYRP